MQDFAKAILGSSLTDITSEQLKSFFEEARIETTTLEFKSYSNQYGNLGKNLEGVIRGICALLNSEGGLLIWGAPMETKTEGISQTIGELVPVPKFKEKPPDHLKTNVLLDKYLTKKQNPLLIY